MSRIAGQLAGRVVLAPTHQKWRSAFVNVGPEETMGRAVSTTLEIGSSDRVCTRLARTLEQLGVASVWGVPGGTITPVIDALLDTGVRVESCVSEVTAGYLAYGAGLQGQPGVLYVTSGPGILAATQVIAAATRDEVPLLVLVGEVARQDAGLGVIQDGWPSDLDVDSVLRSLGKAQETVRHPHQAIPALHRLWSNAHTHPRGAVILRLPMDVQRSTCPPASSSIAFATPSRIPAPRNLEAVHESLSDASSPLLVAGVGARAAGVGELLVELGRRIGARLASDPDARGVIPEDHPLWIGPFGLGDDGRTRTWLQNRADLVLTVGCRLDDTTRGGPEQDWLHGRPWIQLDHDEARIGRCGAPSRALAGDLAPTLEGLIGLCDAAPARIVDSATGSGSKRRPSSADAGLDPYSAIQALQRALPDTTPFVADIGNHMLFAATALRMWAGACFHVSMGLGGMGSGIGAAMGMAWARRDRVVGICGDGGLLMFGNEIATCAKLDIPITLAVMVDGDLGMVSHGCRAIYGRAPELQLPAFDVGLWSRSLGVAHVLVESVLDIERAARVTRGPLVLEIPVQPDFPAPTPRFTGPRRGPT